MLAQFKDKAISTAAKQAANNTTLAKRGQSNGNTLIKIALLGVAGFVAYKAYNKFNGLIKNAVSPVAHWWVDVTGEEAVKTNQAYVFIKSRDINANNQLQPYFIEAMKKAHPQNADILKSILDPLGRIKHEYQHLIDSDTPATLANTGG
ncbi:hypothetical protein [Catenovulum agarivorans]|uniref:hypothetical protein n=1 Tax=Catenovulum agarivorans TaxID=1172192 RepID=UPI0002D80F2D|nr:hypothetical protein [Catenovulum agarivorans]